MAGERAPAWIAAVLLVALAVQCFASMRLKSPTYDEPVYIAAGYTALTTGLDLNPAHAPLMKYLLGVPPLLLGSAPSASLPQWENATKTSTAYGLAFLFENRVDADTLLFASRTSVVLVSLALGLLVWIWTRQLYGPWAAVVALTLYCFSPDVIAYSTLAMLDLGLAAGIAVASYTFWCAYKAPSTTTAVAAGVALAVALLLKSTAVLLLALIPVWLCAAIMWHTRAAADVTRAARRRGASERPIATALLVRTTLVALLAAAVVVAIAYGPHRFGISAYIESVRLGFFNRDLFMNRDYEYFCWGRYSRTGFFWYFLAAFILKAPVAMIVGTVAVAIWLVRRGPRRLFDEIFLVLPVLAFFVGTMFIIDDLGVRYLLPAYPLLFVLIGGMTVDVLRATHIRFGNSRWADRTAAATVAALAVTYVGGTLWIYPNYLSFFNGLFCGPGDGIRYLDDSNIDIGQDFKQLVRYLRAHDIEKVTLFYNPMAFAPYVMDYYGMRMEWMQPPEVVRPKAGWYAVSAHLLQRPGLMKPPQPPLRFDWLDRYEPVAKIGWSIYLYRFE